MYMKLRNNVSIILKEILKKFHSNFLGVWHASCQIQVFEYTKESSFYEIIHRECYSNYIWYIIYFENNKRSLHTNINYFIFLLRLRECRLFGMDGTLAMAERELGSTTSRQTGLNRYWLSPNFTETSPSPSMCTTLPSWPNVCRWKKLQVGKQI